jgi:two-component system, response regulator PdtaR
MRRYLVVDDNREFAENLAEIIGDAGYQTALAVNGREALKLAGKERFDAVITDMKMPELGGADLVRELRTVDPQIASIVVTAYTTDDDLGRARRFGLLGILPKPVPIPRLLELLEVARRDALVAVVEDDVALADNLSEALQSRGFATVVAHSLQDAERIGAAPFAVIADLRMPGTPDGAALAKLRERYPGLPVVVVTGHTDVVRPKDTQGFFFKPFKADEVLATVERLHAERTASAARS